MRRVSTCIAVVALAVLGFPATVFAAPGVTLKAKIVPIPKDLTKRGGPTWPKTGNLLGAPAALEFSFTIKGNEYPSASEGFGPGTQLNAGPLPPRRIDVYLPKGTRVSPKGFPTCPISKFVANLEPPCPKGSQASPPGEASGKVFFGKTAVTEKVTVQAYFAPSNKLTFWIEGRQPAVIEKFATGAIFSTSGPFGIKEVNEIPLIETVSEAPYAMAEQIKVTVGAAMMQGKKLISYGYVPKTCPTGGFPGKAEMWFGGGPESTWVKVTKTAKVPCPKK